MRFAKHFSEQEHARLTERAARAAQRPDDAPRQEVAALRVQLGEETYALPVAHIRLVHQDAPIVSLPAVPAFVAGLANVRGRIYPVYDLGVLLDVPRSEHAMSNTAALLVAAHAQEEFVIALRVDSVGEVDLLPTADLAPLPPARASARRAHLSTGSHIEGILPDGTILVDLAALLADPVLIVDQV